MIQLLSFARFHASNSGLLISSVKSNFGPCAKVTFAGKFTQVPCARVLPLAVQSPGMLHVRMECLELSNPFRRLGRSDYGNIVRYISYSAQHKVRM